MKGVSVMTFLKKSVSILLTLAMIFSLGVCAFAVETGDNDVDFGNLGSLLYGDVDDNDIVNIFDLIALAKASVSGDYSSCNTDKADVDQNTKVDIFDLIALAKSIVAQ